MLQTFQMKYADFYTEIQYSKELALIVGYNRVSKDIVEIISVELVESFGINVFEMLNDEVINKVFQLVENGVNLNVGEK
jgi:hypothetical protein